MDHTNVERIIANATASGQVALPEIESKQILEAIGVPVTMPSPASTAEDAAKLAEGAGFPVVLKVLSPDVTHKSEVGGVELNLRSASEVRDAFGRIRDSLAAKMPKAKFEGVSVQAMAQPGVELLAGITRDEKVGPLVMVGIGGIFVEVLKDTAIRLAPLSASEARSMIEELRGAAMLHGARGAAPAKIDAVVELLVKLSQLAIDRPEIKEMDLNPVAAYADGIKVLDARVLLASAQERQPAAGDNNHARRLENLKRALSPKTVAIIGDKKVNGYMWSSSNLNFKGNLYSVQIDPNEIPGIEALGVTNYKSLAEVKEPVDYAIVAVPRQVTPIIMKDLLANKVAGAGFFTSGFSETQEETGIKLEAALKEAALGSDLALVGPNCMGLYNPALGLCNSRNQPVGDHGAVSFISQSGTHAINFSLQAPSRGVKINKVASIGNAIVLEPADYVQVMSEDPDTKLLGMYIEGVRDGRRLFDNLSKATARMPVVIWKGGATEAGARATFSHTGSLATPTAVWRALMRQSGAVEVDSLDAMLDAVEMFDRGRPVRGKRMGLVAMTGGQSVVITDTFASAGLEIPALSPSSYEDLKSFFNIIGGSYRNPLDAGGTMGMSADQTNTRRILDILSRDPVVDVIVLEITTGLRAAAWIDNESEITALLDPIADFARSTTKPFVIILHPSHMEAIVARAKQLARERDLVVFDNFERASKTLKLAADYWEGRDRLN